MCQEISRKQFSPLWRSCEAGACLFMCQERSRKQFSPLWWSCEAGASLFIYQESSRKQFTPGPVKLVQACTAKTTVWSSYQKSMTFIPTNFIPMVWIERVWLSYFQRCVVHTADGRRRSSYRNCVWTSYPAARVVIRSKVKSVGGWEIYLCV